LVLAGNGILEERGLHRPKIRIGFSVRGKQGLVRQVGGVQGELRAQPVRDAHLLELGDGGRSGSPCRLVQESGGGVVVQERRPGGLCKTWPSGQDSRSYDVSNPLHLRLNTGPLGKCRGNRCILHQRPYVLNSEQVLKTIGKHY